jgi:DNA-directed RNA polymerase subunit F
MCSSIIMYTIIDIMPSYYIDIRGILVKNIYSHNEVINERKSG